MTDSPKTHLTEADFLDKVQDIEPFQLKLGGKKGTVTFPDFNSWTVEEARSMEAKIKRSIDPLDAMREWLPTEEYRRLEAQGFNARKIGTIFQMAYQYTSGAKRARGSISTADLQTECPDPAPFTFTLSSGKRVIFPDFASGTIEEMRDFYQALEMNQADPEVVLKKWIGEKSWENLSERSYNARQLAALCERAIAHYESNRGTPGE